MTMTVADRLAKQRERQRRWRATNLERVREQARRWARRHRAEHPEKTRAYAADWNAHHKERARTRIALHRLRNLETVRAQKRASENRRRVRRLSAGGSHSEAEWLILVMRHHGRCSYCGLSGKLERDHVVPLSRGGSDSIENIAPACGYCNRSKKARTPAEWRGAAA